MTATSRSWQETLRGWLNRGAAPYVIVVGLMAVGTYQVYNNPRSLFAFLTLIASAVAAYFLRTNRWFKVGVLLVLAVGIVPVVGVRNIFYLEVVFQICVYAALALGLNIVVGFAGLLDLGYVAFYAVGAYTWAIFGSKQLSILHTVPGAAPASAPFALSPEWFWFFLIAAVFVTGLTGVLLGLPVLRLKGDYLAIVTLGFGEVIRVLANNLDKPVNINNGAKGITS